jgi:hypothetical protein
MPAEFSFAVTKAQWAEGGGRILLGNNVGGMAVMLQPIRLRCGLARLTVTYGYIWNCVYTQFRLGQNPTFTGRFGVKLLRTSGECLYEYMLKHATCAKWVWLDDEESYEIDT